MLAWRIGFGDSVYGVKYLITDPVTVCGPSLRYSNKIINVDVDIVEEENRTVWKEACGYLRI